MNLEMKEVFFERFSCFCDEFKVRGNKGPLAALLSINRQVRNMAFPLDPGLLITEKGGQVKGLGLAATQRVLNDHGIDKILAREGGRTSRGIMEIMRAYVEFINSWYLREGCFDFDISEEYLVGLVKEYFSSKPFILKLDSSWGVRASIRNLMEQAIARQKSGSGSKFLGTMIQHLVGAKLNVILKDVDVMHHSASQSDQNSDRHGDFDINDVVIHVSVAPSEALIRKCSENLSKGKRPLIVTTAKGMLTAEGLLDNFGIGDRVDLIEFEQFIAANVFELGNFEGEGRRRTFEAIINAYNEIIDSCETDPSLRIHVSEGK